MASLSAKEFNAALGLPAPLVDDAAGEETQILFDLTPGAPGHPSLSFASFTRQASTKQSLPLADPLLLPWCSPTERKAQELLPSFRGRAQVLAYSVARAAPTHAALVRVLSEAAASLPGFKPSTVLDYGAKTGLGLWSIDQVGSARLKAYCSPRCLWQWPLDASFAPGSASCRSGPGACAALWRLSPQP